MPILLSPYPALSQAVRGQVIAELTDTITVEFRLDMEAILLDPLVVTAVDGRGESRVQLRTTRVSVRLLSH